MILASDKVTDRILYCEHYVVNFEVKVGEYWKRVKKTYCSTKKGMQKEVRKQWQRDFPQGKLINIVFC